MFNFFKKTYSQKEIPEGSLIKLSNAKARRGSWKGQSSNDERNDRFVEFIRLESVDFGCPPFWSNITEFSLIKDNGAHFLFPFEKGFKRVKNYFVPVDETELYFYVSQVNKRVFNDEASTG